MSCPAATRVASIFVNLTIATESSPSFSFRQVNALAAPQSDAYPPLLALPSDSSSSATVSPTCPPRSASPHFLPHHPSVYPSSTVTARETYCAQRAPPSDPAKRPDCQYPSHRHPDSATTWSGPAHLPRGHATWSARAPSPRRDCGPNSPDAWPSGRPSWAAPDCGG